MNAAGSILELCSLFSIFCNVGLQIEKTDISVARVDTPVSVSAEASENSSNVGDFGSSIGYEQDEASN